METRKLQIPCPQCGSVEVSYSCTPACCFNHVCAECTTTFEPVTHATGARAAGVVRPPEPLPKSGDPAVACARCDSVAVYAIAAGGGGEAQEAELVCSACGSLLTLEITEIAPG